MIEVHIFDDADAVAAAGAGTIAASARSAIDDRGRFLFAVSGGHTPWAMLRLLAAEDLPWGSVHVFQVDERVAPVDSPDRNFAHLKESLLANAPLPPENVHAMPVEEADLDAAADAYAKTLARVAGSPPVLDLIHLGLGPDGHTASLVPGDPVLAITDRSVACAGPYQGHPRMTLTYPVLDAARLVLFVTDGAAKVDALAKLRRRDTSIPAGRVRAREIEILADKAAMGG